MSWNDLIYGLGEIIEETFVVVDILNNIPNILFTLVILAGIAFWLMQLKKYRENSERTGELE